MRSRGCFLLAIVALCFSGCGGTLEDATLSSSRAALLGQVEPGEPATMMVRFWDCVGCRGSSTLVAPNVVLTNDHVVHWTGPHNIYVQQGTRPINSSSRAGVPQALQVIDYKLLGFPDLALLRLGCRVTGVKPAILNTTPLTTAQHKGMKLKYVGYGPTTWTGTNYGVKRSDIGVLASAYKHRIYPNGILTNPGDSGGSVYGDVPTAPQKEPKTSLGLLPTHPEAGGGVGLVPNVRKLVAVITWDNGKATTVEPSVGWIKSTLQSWDDPNLQEQPHKKTIKEAIPPPAFGTGTYQIDSPQSGVVYTWHATNATIVGSNVGTLVQVRPSKFQTPYTLKVVATTSGGCKETFSQTFSQEEPTGGDDEPALP